jgi:hypothetical protein
MLAVIDVRDQRHDGRDFAALGGGGATEDRQVRVAREIARAADAVHHLLPHHVGGIDVAEHVHLDGGVHRDDAQAPHHFRIVGDLLRAHQNPRAEKFRLSTMRRHSCGG